MADESAIRKPHTADQLRKLLQDLWDIGFLANDWAGFKDFIQKILDAQRQNKETVAFGPDSTAFPTDIEAIFEALPEFFSSEDRGLFRQALLPKWSQKLTGKIVISDDVPPPDFQLLREQSERAKNPRELENLTETIERILRGGEKEAPTEDQAVRTQLGLAVQNHWNDLDSLRGEVAGTLDDYETDVELNIPENLKKQLDFPPDGVPADTAEAVIQQRKQAAETARQQEQKDLNTALEAVFDENWERVWANNERAELIISLLRETDGQPEKETVERFVDAFIEYLERSGALPSPVQAYQDTDQVFIDFLREVSEPLRLIKERREKLIEEHQEKLKKTLAAILAPPSAVGPEMGGGEAEETREAAAATDKGTQALEAKKQLATLFVQFSKVEVPALPAFINQQVGVVRGFGVPVQETVDSLRALEVQIQGWIDGLEALENVTPSMMQRQVGGLLAALAETEKQSPEESVVKKTNIAEAAKKQLSTHFAALNKIDPITLPTVISELTYVARGAGAPVDASIDSLRILEIQIQGWIDGLKELENVSPAAMQQQVDNLLASIREADAEYLEAAKVEKPEAPTAALTTELPGEVELSDAQARKSVGELMDAQQTLVTQGLAELRRSLKEARIPDAEIERIIERNRETVSQQIWLQFLERGGLAAETRMEFSQLATIWSSVVQLNVQRILVEYGVKNEPVYPGLVGANTEQIKRLEKFLKDSRLDQNDIAEIFSHLNIRQFEALVAYANGLPKPGSAERAAAIREILRNPEGAYRLVESDSVSVATLIADNNLFGLLQFELGTSGTKLNIDDKQKLQRILAKAVLSDKDQKELAKYLGIVADKYRDLFFHLNADQLNEIHELLARQQKAMEIIGQQLANFPKSGFANPYTGVTLKRTANVTEEQATAHAKDTLMMEITLSIAFETKQDVHLALVMQEFYTDPKKNLIWLASGLGSAYDDDGGLLPEAGDEALTPQKTQLLAAQRAQYSALAGKQEATVVAQQQNEMAQKAALLRAVLSSGGNPALLAKNLLTDPAARGALMAEFEKHKFEILAAMALPALPILVILAPLLKLAKFLADLWAGIVNVGTSIGQGISGFFTGLSGGGTTAGLTGWAATGFETGANAATAAKVATSQAIPTAQTVGTNAILNTFNGFNTMLAGTTTAFTPLAAIIGAILGPMVFAVIMTFIVFNVIGASLNGTTTEIGLLGGIPGIGRSGCWPVDGTISVLERYDNGDAHAVSPGGTAVDIGAPMRTPVYSPFSGTARARYVPRSGDSTGNWKYGFFIDLRTEFGFRVRFAHLSGYKAGVSAGDTFTVAAGDVIGFVGSTGNSTGPHLHYEAIGVNLYTLLPVPRNQLSVGYRTSTAECRDSGQAGTTQPASNTIGPQ